MTLADLIQQHEFASPAQEAVLNVFATESWVSGEIAAALAPHGVTEAQYNVLRILRGSHPARLACSDIGDRLVDRTPDVTRLLVRLEKHGLVERRRAEHDRRVVEVAITPDGLDTLATLDGPVDRVMEAVTEHLSDDDLATLSALLERMRAGQQ
ncbi:MarR family transcriptional regulator [Rubrivirga sp. S365]|uniref:MarR family transcriptional regulator n=1 Tax=Rubrivirga litoralis TaxID=3075598 RepID=A0ABU3BLY0_9BACT|nr:MULTISPECIES: MarR family transcriptional regulator [unclassified Rubrivirga]MDT0630297.1 MarR family transcriptional regulator [Rubrivirga sp. F394]MDT7855809.1 MarR family transcriptional regulator [Rubrivirga sp. S365]